MADNARPALTTASSTGGKPDTEGDGTTALPPFKALSFLDRFLVVWILLAMAIGIVLGNEVPSVGPALQQSTFVGVSVPIAVGLLVMMYPILCKVRYETVSRPTSPSTPQLQFPQLPSLPENTADPAPCTTKQLHLLFKHRSLWIQLAFSIFANWIVAPLLMTGLAWAFLPDRRELREGLIFVGIARCIAMVLVWTDLAEGDSDYCAVLVAVNSILQMVLFAPLALFYVVTVSGGNVAGLSYGLVAQSVGVFLGTSTPTGTARKKKTQIPTSFPRPNPKQKALPRKSPTKLTFHKASPSQQQ